MISKNEKVKLESLLEEEKNKAKEVSKEDSQKQIPQINQIP